MKILPVILLLSFYCEAQEEKWQQVCAGAVVSTASYHLLVKKNNNKWKSRAGAILITFVAALGKEYIDQASGKGVYNKKDVWATMAGCLSLTLTFPLRRK
jgi:hypothetical protein